MYCYVSILLVMFMTCRICGYNLSRVVIRGFWSLFWLTLLFVLQVLSFVFHIWNYICLGSINIKLKYYEWRYRSISKEIERLM